MKLVEFWQGLENARPAHPAGASMIDRLAKKKRERLFSLAGDIVVILVDDGSYPSCLLLPCL